MTITNIIKCENCRNDKVCSYCHDFCQRRPVANLGPSDLDNGIVGYAPRSICKCEEFVIMNIN